MCRCRGWPTYLMIYSRPSSLTPCHMCDRRKLTNQLTDLHAHKSMDEISSQPTCRSTDSTIKACACSPQMPELFLKCALQVYKINDMILSTGKFDCCQRSVERKGFLTSANWSRRRSAAQHICCSEWHHLSYLRQCVLLLSTASFKI